MPLEGSLVCHYIGRWSRGQGIATLAIHVFIFCALSDQTDLKSTEGYFAWLPRRRRRKTPEGDDNRAK